MNKRQLVMLCITVLLLSGCYTPMQIRAENRENLNKLSIGMTEEEVLETMGPGSSVAVDRTGKIVEVINNPASAMENGAGPIAARTIKDLNVDVLISGEMGPGARTILETYEIKIYEAAIGKKVSDAIKEWLKLGS